MDKFPMTKKGADDLQNELNDLKFVQRPQITAAIGSARELGDLKENAEYHAAREKQSFSEGRIKEIEGKLSHAQVIDVNDLPKNGKVLFGSTVTMVDLETDNEVTYQVVGEDEANITQGKISCTSPLARAMIGKKVDDVVEFHAPKGLVEYEIIRVEYI